MQIEVLAKKPSVPSKLRPQKQHDALTHLLSEDNQRVHKHTRGHTTEAGVGAPWIMKRPRLGDHAVQRWGFVLSTDEGLSNSVISGLGMQRC